MHTKANSAIIIGAGISGLALSIRLAKMGLQVTVFEKNSIPGGWASMNNEEFQDQRLDDEEVAELKKLFPEDDVNFFGNIDLQELEISQRYILPNGKIVNAFTNREALINEMTTNLQEDAATLTRYFDSTAMVNQKITPIVEQPRKKWFAPDSIKLIKYLRPAYFRSLQHYNNSNFKQAESVGLFNHKAGMFGMAARKTPALLGFVTPGAFPEKAFKPGGQGSVINALYKYASELGVKFEFDSEVLRIIHNEGKVVGVVSNQSNHVAPIVISTIDIGYTYGTLLNNKGIAARFLKKGLSNAAVVFYWKINTAFPALHDYNSFLEVKAKSKADIKNASPAFTINVTRAEVNVSHWKVIVQVPAISLNDYNELTESARSTVIERLNNFLSTNLEDAIVHEEVEHPGSMSARFSLTNGSLHGPVIKSKWPGFNRHPNLDKEISNLYFCGNTVHPGPGLLLSLKSAAIVSGLINKQLKLSATKPHQH